MDSRESEKPLGRGLADVSHLFLSQRTERGGGLPSDIPAPAPYSLPALNPTAVLLRASPPLPRERLSAALKDVDSGIEEGLRTIDVNMPCPPHGAIDFMALDRGGQLTVVDFAAAQDDLLLVRGVGHLDWVSQNLSTVRRMYAGYALNQSLPPRLLLLAPRFSTLFGAAARQITRFRIDCVRYHVVDAPGVLGILFEPVTAE
jgi:hypothetical protein